MGALSRGGSWEENSADYYTQLTSQPLQGPFHLLLEQKQNTNHEQQAVKRVRMIVLLIDNEDWESEEGMRNDSTETR